MEFSSWGVNGTVPLWSMLGAKAWISLYFHDQSLVQFKGKRLTTINDRSFVNWAIWSSSSKKLLNKAVSAVTSLFPGHDVNAGEKTNMIWTMIPLPEGRGRGALSDNRSWMYGKGFRKLGNTKCSYLGAMRLGPNPTTTTSDLCSLGKLPKFPSF